MSKRFEGHFRGFDQTEIFYQTWTPDVVRGSLIMTHGLAEHSECYHPLAKILCDDGWQVYGWDLRGHGRSEGKRGYVRSIGEYVSDLEILTKLVAKSNKGSAPVYFGHSMGGLVTITHLQINQPEYSALALSSPALGLSMPVPAFKQTLAHVAIKWLPTLTMHNEIKYTDLSHDPVMLKGYAQDPLRHDKISPGLFLSMVERFPLAMAEADRIRGPVIMQLAGEDRLVSTPAAREFFEKLPNGKKQMHVYGDSYHEVFNDLEREGAIADLKKFLNPYLGA
jgi:alpha-beta hydrolase superfamily lysophospholipase